MGLSYTGSKCLLVTLVIGKRRLPVPPARTTPFMLPPGLTVDTGIRKRLERLLDHETDFVSGLGPSDGLHRLPFHFRNSQPRMGYHQMPDQSLKIFCVARYGR